MMGRASFAVGAGNRESEVVTVDMHNGNSVTTKPMKAEAALMNPRDNVIALKAVNDGGAGHFIQVFDLDTKAKLGVPNLFSRRDEESTVVDFSHGQVWPPSPHLSRVDRAKKYRSDDC